jgi:hypothetical protein
VVKDCNKRKDISVTIAGIYENCSNLTQQYAPLKNKSQRPFAVAHKPPVN